MRVLLLQEVKALGVRGDLVSVADGYARNFLIPRKLAAPADAGTERYAAQMRVREEKRREEIRKRDREIADRLSGVSCSIARKAGEDEKLFGSVSGADIAEALKGQGFDLDRHAVILESPIKALGVFSVEVRISPEVSSSIKVWVVKETEKA